VLRRIFITKKRKWQDNWRRLYNEDLHNLYPSPYSIRVIRRMGWTGYAARMAEICTQNFGRET
jgi:hypothetical protein